MKARQAELVRQVRHEARQAYPIMSEDDVLMWCLERGHSEYLLALPPDRCAHVAHDMWFNTLAVAACSALQGWGTCRLNPPCTHSNLDTVKWLLANGANVNQDHHLGTALEQVCRGVAASFHGKQRAVARLLLDARADANTALRQVCQEEHDDSSSLVALLLTSPIEPDVRTEAFLSCVRTHKARSAGLLLAAKADVKGHAPRSGASALELAVRHEMLGLPAPRSGREDILGLLLLHGCPWSRGLNSDAHALVCRNHTKIVGPALRAVLRLPCVLIEIVVAFATSAWEE